MHTNTDYCVCHRWIVNRTAEYILCCYDRAKTDEESKTTEYAILQIVLHKLALGLIRVYN